RVIGKKSLKLRERLGESQIVALVDVHSRHDGQTLALVGVCVNRIGKIARSARHLLRRLSLEASTAWRMLRSMKTQKRHRRLR
ncbi:MAG TPA: hypothetical protein VJY34_12795, partial [Roseiarcus sp.]|nr:hypothetical protein [Roseiarcus sp.]